MDTLKSLFGMVLAVLKFLWSLIKKAFTITKNNTVVVLVVVVVVVSLLYVWGAWKQDVSNVTQQAEVATVATPVIQPAQPGLSYSGCQPGSFKCKTMLQLTEEWSPKIQTLGDEQITVWPAPGLEARTNHGNLAKYDQGENPGPHSWIQFRVIGGGRMKYCHHPKNTNPEVCGD